MVDLPADYNIEFAGQLDIPALIASDRAASELFRTTGLIPDMAAIPESVPAEIFSAAIDDGLVLAVKDHGTPVGFALCRIFGKSLYLDQISVDPDHGRQGLGAALMEYVMQLAAERDCQTVVLSTFRDVAWNGPFYRKLGFRELPRRKLAGWMLDIEAAQAETLDISKRCFMQRTVKRARLRRTG